MRPAPGADAAGQAGGGTALGSLSRGFEGGSMSESTRSRSRSRRSVLDRLLGLGVLDWLASAFHPVIRYFTLLPLAGPLQKPEWAHRGASSAGARSDAKVPRFRRAAVCARRSAGRCHSRARAGARPGCEPCAWPLWPVPVSRSRGSRPSWSAASTARSCASGRPGPSTGGTCSGGLRAGRSCHVRVDRLGSVVAATTRRRDRCRSAVCGVEPRVLRRVTERSMGYNPHSRCNGGSFGHLCAS